ARPIRRTVVDHHDREARIVLCEEARERWLDRPGLVGCGDHHAERRPRRGLERAELAELRTATDEGDGGEKEDHARQRGEESPRDDEDHRDAHGPQYADRSGAARTGSGYRTAGCASAPTCLRSRSRPIRRATGTGGSRSATASRCSVWRWTRTPASGRATP